MKIKFLALPLLASSLFFAGCGKDKELEAFHDDMANFCTQIQQSAAALNAIDPASENAVDEMLSQLDTISSQFEELAAIEVPKQFSSVEDLADEASDYMNQAAATYQEAFANDSYDSSIGSTAFEYYSRAMKRLEYISELLQGQIPEDDSVTVVTEEEPSWGLEETQEQ